MVLLSFASLWLLLLLDDSITPGALSCPASKALALTHVPTQFGGRRNDKDDRRASEELQLETTWQEGLMWH